MLQGDSGILQNPLKRTAEFYKILKENSEILQNPLRELELWWYRAPNVVNLNY